MRTFQAEDEIAAVGAALGASFGGSLGVTTSAGPGVVLKSETVGLAIALELPLPIFDVQRAGPSTGMPTKPEQGDLLMVLFGRNGESPVPVIAASTPGDCFYAAIEAVRVALTYRTPVYLLSDAYLANGAEPWLVPDIASLAPIHGRVRAGRTRRRRSCPTCATRRRSRARGRSRARRGSSIAIGGLEKANETGIISYDADNHDLMMQLRAQRSRVARLPELEVDHQEGADVLVLSWGGTYGPVARACGGCARRREGRARAPALAEPVPGEPGDVLRSYDRVLIPEMNLGQLLKLVRAELPRRRGRLQPGARASRSRRGRSPTRGGDGC